MQAYYAVKANPDPAIVKTLYEAGASFDVASMPEFLIVHEYIKDLPAKERQDFIWDKIIYANPIKANETLARAGPVQAAGDLRQPRGDRQDPQARPARRAWPCGCKVPNTGAMVELSSKFGAASGEAVDLIEAAHDAGLVVEGLSFHVGSQTHQLRELRAGAEPGGRHLPRGRPSAASKMKLLDIGGGFPAPYDDNVQPLQRTGPADQRRTRPAVPARTSRSWPSRAGSWWPPPARWWPRSSARPSATANAATTSTTASITPSPASSSTTASTTSRRSRRGRREICSVFGPTCDALDTISLAEELPDLELGDLRLQREHRRLQPRLLDLLQRLPAGQGGAYQSVGDRTPHAPREGSPSRGA